MGGNVVSGELVSVIEYMKHHQITTYPTAEEDKNPTFVHLKLALPIGYKIITSEFHYWRGDLTKVCGFALAEMIRVDQGQGVELLPKYGIREKS